MDDYVELDTTNLNTSADFTVQFDVIDYGPNSNANHAWRVYFSNLGNGNPYAGIAVYSQYSQIGFFYNVPPNQISVVELPSDNSFNLAVSYNQSTIKFYLNGSLVYEDVATINYSEVNKFIIGSRPQYQSCDNECGLISNCLNGNIDNFNFWNYELNQESIQSNIDNPVSTDDAGLVGSWNFNAGEGTILYDQSGNENHGTIQGNPEWLCNDIIDACGVCGGDDSSCSGCTDSYAENYNSDANWDDGSCTGYPDNGDYSLQFDGVDDYVYVEDIQLAGLSSYTIQNKLSFNSNPNTNKMGILGASEGSGYESSKYAIILNPFNNNTFVWHQATNNTYVWLDFTTPSLDIYADYDFIFIKQNNEYSLYINGILQTSKLSDFETPYVDSEFRIGSDGEGWSFLNGNMDELLIWDRVLSEEEISGQDSDGGPSQVVLANINSI